MSGFKIVKMTIETYAEYQERIKDDPEMAATPIDRRSESGQPIFFDVILDVSGSMSEYYDELVTGFNDVMIPALQGAAERYNGPMRLGCLLFSDKLVPAWRGFKPLKELGNAPLKRKMLNQPGLGGTTALYAAMRSGILWTAAAMEQMRKTGKGATPKGKIIVLTDGANNEEPKDEAVVAQALDSIGETNRRTFVERKKGEEKNQKVIGFFNTSDGLTEAQFNAMATSTGFHGGGFYQIAQGETLDERRRAFRHHFQIFSRHSTA